MDLDDYKIIKQREEDSFSLKEPPELAGYMRGQARSVIDKIKKAFNSK